MTTSDPMLQDGASDGRSRRPSTVKTVLVAILAAFAVFVVGFAIYAYQQAKHYYTYAPGTAPLISPDGSCPTTGSKAFSLPNGKPCVRLVLPSGQISTINGSIHMVDVLVGPTTWGDYVLNKVHLLHTFDDGSQLYPASEVLGTTPASQLVCQDDQDMVDSDSYAEVVALRSLGYTVKENDFGAQVDEVEPGSAAAKAKLECNDLITAINGTKVATSIDLVNALHKLNPGGTAHLSVERSQSNGKEQQLSLTAVLGSTPAMNGEAAQPKQAFLGIATETRLTYTFPINVQIDVGDIGGPSAGLALTLGLINSLSGGQLTGGLPIAATGTIDLQGDVGDVGGVAQKTVAVRRAGAKVFFVPPQELKAAESEADGMKVIAVSSLAETLADLKSMGGHVPSSLSLPSSTTSTTTGTG